MILSWILKLLKARQAQKSKKYISKLFTNKKFAELESLIGFSIKNRDYFIQALMHRSFLEQHSEYDFSNERLEFLGDAVLNLVVAENLYQNYPQKDEGFLTKVRAKLVNKHALAEAADRINLTNYLLISKNLLNSFEASSRTVLSDALEALIGAVYMDNGLVSAQDFIEKILIEPNAREELYLIDENYKSQLLEYTQAKKYENPVYSIVKEEGPQHNRIFTVNVTIGNMEYGSGTGKNKKTAEQNAARIALQSLLKENSNFSK